MSLARRITEKAATFGAGMAMKKALDYGFDYLLYPAALLGFGYLWGTLVMTVLSVFLNLGVIRAYDWSKRDWFLLESLKEMKSTDGMSRSGRLVRWVLRKGDVAAFFLLSWIEDPIIVTLYLRHGSHGYNGLDRRGWSIFWASTVVSNLFWALSVVSVIEIARALF